MVKPKRSLTTDSLTYISYEALSDGAPFATFYLNEITLSQTIRIVVKSLILIYPETKTRFYWRSTFYNAYKLCRCCILFLFQQLFRIMVISMVTTSGGLFLIQWWNQGGEWWCWKWKEGEAESRFVGGRDGMQGVSPSIYNIYRFIDYRLRYLFCLTSLFYKTTWR